MKHKLNDGTIVVDSAKEAAEVVRENGYWTPPMHISSPAEDAKFTRKFRATDWSQENCIHYQKK